MRHRDSGKGLNKVACQIFLVLVCLVCFWGATANASDLQAGREALKTRDCKTAEEILLPVAQGGNAEAQYHMGRVVACFDHNARARAFTWYLQAAENGFAEAQLAVGRNLQGGYAGPKDPEKARMWVEKAAGQGLASAEFELALAYKSKRPDGFIPESERDITKALGWMTRAADHNMGSYGYFLAQIYEADISPPDHAKAFQLYLQAAEQGAQQSKCKVVEFYTEGKGTLANAAQAFYWNKSIVKAGREDKYPFSWGCLEKAEFEVARAIYEGKGTPKNEKEGFFQLVMLAGGRSPLAETWLNKQALNQDVDQGMGIAASWKMRIFYRDLYGGHKIENLCDESKPQRQEDKASLNWFLGVCNEYGLVGSPDMEKAIEFYSRSAKDTRHKDSAVLAQKKLGDFYWEGEGVEKDSAEAFSWYSQAAERGYYLAQYAVGTMLEAGAGVSPNSRTAMDWYQKAARPFEKGKDKLLRPQKGYARAQYALGKLYEQGGGGQRDEKLAREWYQKAADQGFALAKESLGR